MAIQVKTDAELRKLIELIEQIKNDQSTDLIIAKSMPLLSGLDKDDIRQADLRESIGDVKKDFNTLIGSSIVVT